MKNTDKSTHWDGLNCFGLVFNYEVQNVAVCLWSPICVNCQETWQYTI